MYINLVSPRYSLLYPSLTNTVTRPLSLTLHLSLSLTLPLSQTHSLSHSSSLFVLESFLHFELSLLNHEHHAIRWESIKSNIHYFWKKSFRKLFVTPKSSLPPPTSGFIFCLVEYYLIVHTLDSDKHLLAKKLIQSLDENILWYEIEHNIQYLSHILSSKHNVVVVNFHHQMFGFYFWVPLGLYL